MGNCSSTSSSTRTEELGPGTGPSQTGTTTAAVSQTGAVPSNNKSLNKSQKSTSGGRQKSSERGGAAGGRTGSPAPTTGASRSGGPGTDPDSDNGAGGGATSGGGKHSPHLGPSKDRPPPTPILSSAKPKGAAKKDRVLANKYVADTHHAHHASHGSSGGGLAVQVDGNASGADAISPASSPDHLSRRRPSIGGAGGNSGGLASGAPASLEVSAPLEGDAISGHFLRVSSSPKHAASSPKHGRQGSQGSRNERRRSRRSSEGRRLLAEATQRDQDNGGAGGGADAIRTPPFTSAPRRLTGNRDVAASPPLGPTGSARRQQSNPRRRSGQQGGTPTRRRTSNNGMMSRLALQFPMVRTSFLAVYRAFEKYMHYVRKAEEAVEKRRSLRAGSLLTGANAMLQLRVADESKLQSTGGEAPLSKQSTESRIGAGMPSSSQQSRAPHTGQVAHNPTASSTGADLQMDQQPERSELGALVKAADHAASAAEIDRELDGMSEDDLRKHEIAALIAASPIPLLDAGATAATSTSPTAAASSAAAASASSSSSTAAPATAASSSADPAATGLVIRTSPPVPTVSANSVAALGTLTVDRLGDALQAVTGSEYPLPDAELSAIFSSADLDHSGGISFREFLVAVALGCFLKDDLERDRRAKAEALARAEAEKAAAAAAPVPVALHRVASRPSPRTGPGQSAAAIAAGVPSPRRLDLHTDAPASAPGHASHPSMGGSQLSPKLGAQEQSAPPVVQINNLTGGSPAIGATLAAASSASHPNSPAAAAVGSGAGGNRRPSLLSHVSTGGGSSVGVRTPSSSHFAEVARGFRVVYAAFREMDADRSESVERSELKRALFSAAPMKSDSALLESRFRELDFDDSGEINLAEFLYGVVSWVGLMEEDEELEQRG